MEVLSAKEQEAYAAGAARIPRYEEQYNTVARECKVQYPNNIKQYSTCFDKTVDTRLCNPEYDLTRLQDLRNTSRLAAKAGIEDVRSKADVLAKIVQDVCFSGGREDLEKLPLPPTAKPGVNRAPIPQVRSTSRVGVPQPRQAVTA